LAELLPKSKELKTPPFLEEKNMELYKRIFIALCYFLKKYEEAIRIGIEECVKLVEKIIPFLVLKVIKK
jgi:hypothetical protein